ncbi:hypothetical protein AYI68_g5890 [Smittium mucronatum]|uniref:pH-response regulator protein palC n=1 Tax=Smittium mucronatum TaxID=133383 RepID=A0A1R0GT09_9FUNG|nr:hypothetical protein AYI68_g6970 [Smittium mucronatum]OLY80027.1 hypothetical protein AYI68_g5890 [Smittium mucronatum]
MYFYMRLPNTKPVSLLDLVKVSNQNDSGVPVLQNPFLEKLLDLTRLREKMRTLLKDADNIHDSFQANALVESISLYMTELQLLKTSVESTDSFEFSEQIVFVWNSSLLENRISGATSFYTKKIRETTKSDLKNSLNNQFSNLRLMKQSFKSGKSGKDLELLNSNTDNSEVLNDEKLEAPKTKSLLIESFVQRSCQSPNLDFELANVLLTLGIAKVFKSYTQFNNFEFYLESEDLMLPFENSTGKNPRDAKPLKAIKNIFPFNKKDGKGSDSRLLSSSKQDFNFAEYEKLLSKVVLELRESAGIFHHILTNVTGRIQLTDLGSSDLNPTVLLILQKLSLADADRLVAGKAVALGYKSNVISRMLLFVSEQYSNVLDLAETIRLDAIQSLNKEFNKSIKRRREFVSGLALIYLAKDAYEKNQFGESVSFINESQSILTKLSKKSSEISNDCSIQSALAYCNSIHNLYIKNNDTFGFEAVPSFESIKSKIPSGRPFNDIISFQNQTQKQAFF